MRLFFPLVLVLTMVAIGRAPTTALAQTRTLTVTPNTALADTQEVAVAGTEFTPSVSVAFCQGVQTATPSVSDCGTGFHETTTDASGNFSGSQVLQRFISVPSLNATVDCANPTNPCVIGAAEISNIAGTATYAHLQFAPAPPRIDAGAANVPEGNSGTTDLMIPVHLSFPSGDTVTAQWQTTVTGQPNEADPSSDYTPTSGVVTFAPGQTEQTVTVSVNGDIEIEDAEEITVAFTNPTNATIGQADGVGTIVDDDTPPRIDPGTAAVAEGFSGTTDLALPVRLSNPSGDTVTVQWRTAFGPGLSGPQADPANDYTAANGTLTFAPGQTEQTAHIAVHGDPEIEADEYLVVALSNASNATIGGYFGLTFAFIQNDD